MNSGRPYLADQQVDIRFGNQRGISRRWRRDGRAHSRLSVGENSPLGEPESWPQGLRTAVRVLLTTQHPMFIFWGHEHTCLYNDAYSRSLGPEKHPSILGAPGRESWEEIWPIIGPQIEQVMRGEGATWHENQLVPIMRHGALQDVYWTYSFSPIDEPEFPLRRRRRARDLHRDDRTSAGRAAAGSRARTLRAAVRSGADVSRSAARPRPCVRARKSGLPETHRPPIGCWPQGGRCASGCCGARLSRTSG